MADAPRILIVGAGHAGLAAAHGVLARLRRATVVIFEPRETHLLKPRLLEALGADMTVEIPLGPYLGSSRIRWIHGAAKFIDPTEPSVEDHEGNRWDGDFVVIANGARTRTLAGVPKRGTAATGARGGAPSSAKRAIAARRFRIDSLEHVLGLRDHLADCVERAAGKVSDAKRRSLLSVLIVGGGYTGVESAAEIALLLRRTTAAASVSPALVHVTLCEQSERLFAGGVPDEELARRVDEALARKAVDVRTGLEVRFEGGIPIVGRKPSDASTVILATGIEGTIAVPPAHEARSRRWAVDAALRVAGTKTAFATGDVSLLERPTGARAGAPSSAKRAIEPAVVASAQHAVQAGDHAAAAIAAIVRGKAVTAFEPSTLGEFVTLGEGDVVGWVQIAGRRVHLSGLPAATARSAAFARYLARLRLGAALS